MANAIDIDWTLFLGRVPADLDLEMVEEFLRGKRVLITGAGGSIGSALARRIAAAGVERLIALDMAEYGLFELGAALGDAQKSLRTELVVGDVCDAVLLRELFAAHRPHVVFHAAAYKHVSLVEVNPFAAARNNILGTQRLLEAATASGAEQVIVISTDKAVDPAGIMGATKRVVELLVLACAELTNGGRTQVKAVRLANVLGSSGSVVPTFLRQIAGGGPITITDPACTRYFVSMEEAVRHLVSALAVDCASAVIVPESGGAFSVLELAQFLAGASDAEVVYTGLAPGEKVVEQMRADDESLKPTNVPLLQVASGQRPSVSTLHQAMKEIERAIEQRDLRVLLSAIAALVPAYRPSRQMLERVG